MTSAVPRRKQLTGTVVAARRMAKTITVTIERRPWHQKLQKQYRQTRRLLVHDAKEEAGVGDLVIIEATRPLSRRKHFRLLRITTRAKISDSASVETPKDKGADTDVAAHAAA